MIIYLKNLNNKIFHNILNMLVKFIGFYLEHTIYVHIQRTMLKYSAKICMYLLATEFIKK